MRIKTKIITNVAGIVASSVLVTAIFLTWTAELNAAHALEEQVEQRLIGLRDSKAEQIQSYFQTIENQIQTQATSTLTVEALRQFIDAFEQ